MPILKRSGIQLCTPFSERRLLNQGAFRSTWNPPYAIQPKLNGERARAIVKNSRCILVSSTDQLICTVPHINYAMTLLPDKEYDGELYVHGWPFSKIHSVISTTTSIHPDAEQLQFHIFDLITPQTQLERIQDLYKKLYIHLDAQYCIKLVPINFVTSMNGILEYLKQYIDNKYEGFILRELTAYYLRRRSQLVMKFKPRESDTYTILDILEARSEYGVGLGMVGSFTCIDDMGTTFGVGAGQLTHPKRRELWQKWLNKEISTGAKLLIKYQTLSDKEKVPLFAFATDILL